MPVTTLPIVANIICNFYLYISDYWFAWCSHSIQTEYARADQIGLRVIKSLMQKSLKFNLTACNAQREFTKVSIL